MKRDKRGKKKEKNKFCPSAFFLIDSSCFFRRAYSWPAAIGMAFLLLLFLMFVAFFPLNNTSTFPFDLAFLRAQSVALMTMRLSGQLFTVWLSTFFVLFFLICG